MTTLVPFQEEILTAYRTLVEYIARKLAFHQDDVPDLIQVGNIGLLKSLESYETNRNATFSTFASSNIIGEIKHYIRDKSRIVKLPRKLQEQFSKIRQFIKTNTQETGRFPTTSEIAKALEITEEDVLESLEAGQSYRIVSLDKPIHSNKSKSYDEKYALIDSLGNEFKDDKLLNKEVLKKALTNLNERDKKIIYLRYYEGLTQKEIADRLGLSQMHISRLLNDALKKLKKKITT